MHVALKTASEPTRYGTEASKIIYAMSLCDGDAYNWLAPKTSLFMKSMAVKDLGLSSLTAYMEAVKQQFGDPHEIAEAERKILTLRQRGSIQAYNTLYDEKRLLIDWDDRALMTTYKNGLRKEVQLAIAVRGDTYDDVEELKQAATEISGLLFDVERSQRAYFPTRTRQHQSYRKGDPMDLDALGKASSRNGIRCYQCGKKGHKKAS